MKFPCIPFALATVFFLAGGALAQTAADPPTPPAKSAPPALPDFGTEPDLEPKVTIIRKDAETHEEVRVNGELKYIRVTPRVGKPYYLVPSGNGQTLLRYDSLDSGMRVPMWLLFSW